MRPLALALTLALAATSCGPAGGASGDAATDARPMLPLPAVQGLVEIEDTNPDPRVVEVNLTAAETDVELVAGRMTRAMTYNGRVPGPLLHARVGDRVIVHFTNNLAEPTTVHWHGLRISDVMDGSPRVQTPVPAGGTFTYDFVVPDAGTFWYHAHVHETQQMEKGLYGAIVVHEAEPPAFRAERVLVLDDIRLNTARQVSPFMTTGPDIGRGRVGNFLLVNGRTSPEQVTVQPGSVERWRIINGGNALTHTLGIEGAYFRVIATDGGFLPTPLEVSEVTVSPGQRVELEVRYVMNASTMARLVSYLQVLDANNRPVTQDETMLGVTIAGAPVNDVVPTYPAVTLPRTDVTPAQQIDMVLSGRATDTGVTFSINGVPGHMHRTPPVQVMQNQPVRITVRADVSPEHPFHLHGQFFQVVARGGMPVNEPGFFDVVRVEGRESVTVLTYFENPGMWMYHCHITEHSENGMMGEFEVLQAR